MKINAIVEGKEGNTLVLEFPCGIYSIYEQLEAAGIGASPKRIALSDEDGDDVRVKLYSEEALGQHLILTLNERNTLADANTLALVVDNAKPEFRSELEANILNDRYSSMHEVVDAAKRMLRDSGPVKAVFYCPLTCEIDDGEGGFSADDRFLSMLSGEIADALEKDLADDENDMAEYFNSDDGVKAKLMSAVWGVEPYRGRLFGRIECSLKEALTEDEKAILTDWILGQNSDGYGEHFEQQPIKTDEGDLYVSFWNSGDDYRIMERDELDGFIDGQGFDILSYI